jgi:hypothetical protein
VRGAQSCDLLPSKRRELPTGFISPDEDNFRD